MKLAILGATGNVGRRLVHEALARGHAVTALARDPGELDPQAGLVALAADAGDPDSLAPRLAGHEAVISAVGFRQAAVEDLIAAVRASGVRRWLVAGGAGSLWAGPDRLHLDSPGFPEFAREEATLGKRFLDRLREVGDLDWTMLSPSALLTAGARTGVFRLGDDSLLTAADGRSWFSYEDFAAAMLDEAETPRHIRRRFTVGY